MLVRSDRDRTCLLKNIHKRWKSWSPAVPTMPVCHFSPEEVYCTTDPCQPPLQLRAVPWTSLLRKSWGLAGFMHRSLGWLPLHLGGMVFTCDLVLSLFSTAHTLPSKKAVWLKWTAWWSCDPEVWQTALSTFTRQVLVCNSILSQVILVFSEGLQLIAGRDLGRRSPWHLIYTHSHILAVILYFLEVIIHRQKWDRFGANHSSDSSILNEWIC